MSKKILANDGLEKSGIDLLKSAGFDVITDKVAQESLIDYINTNNVNGILVRSATKVRKDMIDACPGLKFIGRGGVGMDNIDVDYAKSKGLAVENTPAASTRSVAELVFSHIYCIARMLHESNRQMPLKGVREFNDLKKNYSKGFELEGKTLGVIGFGRIGQTAAKIGLGNGMKVIAYDPYVNKVNIEMNIGGNSFSIPLDTVSFEEVLKTADIFTLHIPMPVDGKPVLGDTELATMKKGAVVINTARGGIIDEKALLKHLNTGQIGFAGLDVFENEPTPMPELLVHPKVSSSPHIGGSTAEAQERVGAEIAEKVISYFKN
jgi:D-3-phosphoglycerate dehydrogenase